MGGFWVGEGVGEWDGEWVCETVGGYACFTFDLHF